jgi:hypothetical protein
MHIFLELGDRLRREARGKGYAAEVSIAHGEVEYSLSRADWEQQRRGEPR